MALALMFIVTPVLIYLVVVCLPAGRPALIGIVVAGLLVGLIWLGYPLSIGPLWTGDSHADAFMMGAAWLYTLAWAAAALTQTAGRRLIARSPALSYPVAAVLVLVLTMVPLFLIVGL